MSARFLPGLVAALLLAGVAAAQDAPPAAPAPPPVAQNAAPATPPPRPRNRPRRPIPAAEAPAVDLFAAPRPAPPPAGPRYDPAPVPNRELDRPITLPPPTASFGPNVINRRLPSTGATVEGAQNRYDSRSFTPAPGATLSLPFSY